MLEKILFIYFFQPFAQYRNPLTFYYAQSYPLPPKTTIVGMLQRITNRYYDDEYWNLKISVHGGFESRFWNLQQLITAQKIYFAKIGNSAFIHFSEEENKIPLPLYGSKTKMAAKAYRGGLTHQEELFNGHVYMFIKGKEDLLEEIYKAVWKLPTTVLRLGRSEDIIFIREVLWISNSDEVTVEERLIEDTLMLPFPTYIRLKGDNNTEIGLRKESLRRFPIYTIPVCQSFCVIPRSRRGKLYSVTKATHLYELLSADFEQRRRDVYFETVIWTGFNAILEFEKPTKALFIKIRDDLRFWIINEFGWL